MWRIGHAQDHEKGTGCTVLIFPDGATASCDIRGGAPGTRETVLLAPECTIEKINALVLTGGSARGLSAADGVMRYCEERGWGFDSGFGVIPLVPAACLFDLGCGEPSVWPEPSMGMEACLGARPIEESPMGNCGAGTGATVGKYSPVGNAMKSGLGWSRKESGKLEVCAVTAVNAFGAVRDLSGGFMAGALDGNRIIDPGSISGPGKVWDEWGRSTTLAAIVTNARLDKAACKRIALMGQAGLAGAISPFNTPFDGDSVFCAATDEIESPTVLVGWLAALALEEAARNAVLHAKSAFGFISFSDLR